jgi:hypothetical protein
MDPKIHIEEVISLRDHTPLTRSALYTDEINREEHKKRFRFTPIQKKAIWFSFLPSYRIWDLSLTKEWKI